MKQLLALFFLCASFGAWTQCDMEVNFSVNEPTCYSAPYQVIPQLFFNCPAAVSYYYQWSYNDELGLSDYPNESATIGSLNELPPGSVYSNESNPVTSICLQIVAYDENNMIVVDGGYCQDIYEIYTPIAGDIFDTSCEGTCIDFQYLYGDLHSIDGIETEPEFEGYCFTENGTYLITVSDPFSGCEFSVNHTVSAIGGGISICPNASEVADQTIIFDTFCIPGGDPAPAFPDEQGYKWYKINSGDQSVLNLSAQTSSGWPTLNVEVLKEQVLDDCSSLISVGNFSGANNVLQEAIESLDPNTNYYIVVPGDLSMSFTLGFTLSNSVLDQSGCTEENNCNYNPDAILDFDCALMGCMDELACNYDSFFTCDDGNCIFPSTLVLQLYNDVNGNNQWNQGGMFGEPALGNIGSIFVEELGLTLFPNSDGQVLLPSDTPLGNYTVSFDPLDSPWTTATESVELALPSCGIRYFPLITDTEELVQISGPCCIWNMNIHCQNGFNPGLWVENSGNVPFDGVFTMTFDPILAAEDLNGAVPFSSFEDGVMTWNVEDQQPGESFLYQTHIVGPGTDLIGQVFPISMQFELYNSDDELYTVGEWVLEPQVTCAYDPNDKYAEPAGYEEPHFVLNDTQIEYRIRFQNTGNAPAETVVIEDQLDLNVLEMSTFNPLFASHDFTTSVNASGKVIFTFDNIQLPDSTTDEPGSQGFVVYTISPIAGLTHGDEINNFAEIYFDLNPAIVTNTYQHTIFECSSIDTSVPIGGYLACEEESFTSDYTQDYIETYSWEYDENLVENSTGSIDMEILESGNYPVLITLSNPLCTAEIETVATIAAPPSNQLDFNNGELMAQEGVLYIWFLDGELIEGANEQTLIPTDTGEYTVVVTNVNGCSQASEAIVVAPSVNESSELDFLLFPNPATNEVVLDLPNGTWNLRILNSIGRLLVEEQTVSNTLKVDLSSLSAGLYHVSINNKEVKMIKKLVIQ